MGDSDVDDTVYLCDFGLSKRYMVNGQHIEHITNKRGLTGTPRFASINALSGHEQSRRDDLESLGYVLVYLCKGSLPWSGLRQGTRSQNHARIRDIKINTRVSSLCAGLPSQFAKFIRTCRRIGFAEQPDYSRLERYLIIAHNE
jgi:casein kinase I family protein HRR25